MSSSEVLSNEMKEALEAYIKEKLSVCVDVSYPYYNNRASVRVDLCFDGETFSYWSDDLPSVE